MRKKKTRAAKAGTRATGTAIAGETIPSATSTPRVHEATVPPTSTAVTAARGTPRSTNRCVVWSVPPMKIGRRCATLEITTSVVSNTAGPTMSTTATMLAPCGTGVRNSSEITASMKPRNSDPASPMKIRAGCQL